MGYVLSMMDPRIGIWTEVFNGGNNYPTITSYIIRNKISSGLAYRFKVKAAYFNGYSPDSGEGIIYSCSVPS